ncbi:MAG TPA: response regulator [Candidatus Dormibacteraeota bacterium]|nr:response regulator [Candidatus Dormibacteraeota bacterium]
MSDGANLSQQQEANQELNQELNQEFEYCLDDILASANFEPDPCAANASASASATAYAASTLADRDGSSGVPVSEAATAHKPSIQEAADALRNEPPADRRRRRRALISAPVRVRGINVTDAVVDEISTTIDVSRAGILFLSTSPNYARGMEVAVIFPYSTAPAALHAEQPGRIVRAFATSDGRYAVAVALGEGVGEDIVDSCGRKLADSSPAPRMPLAPPAAPLASYGSLFSLSREPNSKRPLVLVVDADEMVRATLKAYLGSEGYDVMAVSNSPDAREVMNMFTPALVIAEVEGDGLPGYDLCAHVKQSPRLKHVPVVLTTSSGYPSDYSNAHALGAVVCMTKPYKQERLGHVVRLLAPPPAEFCTQKSGAPRPADPSRRCGYGNVGANGGAKPAGNARFAANPLKRIKFPSFR